MIGCLGCIVSKRSVCAFLRRFKIHPIPPKKMQKIENNFLPSHALIYLIYVPHPRQAKRKHNNKSGPLKLLTKQHDIDRLLTKQKHQQNLPPQPPTQNKKQSCYAFVYLPFCPPPPPKKPKVYLVELHSWCFTWSGRGGRDCGGWNLGNSVREIYHGI